MEDGGEEPRRHVPEALRPSQTILKRKNNRVYADIQRDRHGLIMIVRLIFSHKKVLRGPLV